MAAITAPQIPALKHLFPFMSTFNCKSSRALFFYCSKTCFAYSFDHFLNVCFSFLKINHSLLFFEAHLGLLHSVEPLQGSPHSEGASPSRHAFNPQSHRLGAPNFSRIDMGSVAPYRPGT